MLEKMSDFFKARLDGYDEHMLTVEHEITALKDAGFYIAIEPQRKKW